VPSQHVSIKDVAQRAKVSISTVSRVINRSAPVSNASRKKIEEAIAHLKFKPNISAQRLAGGTNKTIGLIMPGYPGIFHSYYAVEILRGVGHACESSRFDLLFHISDGQNQINTHSAGGFIFSDIQKNRKQLEAAISTSTPCIVINNLVKDIDVNYISIDNHLGGQLATEYLINLGHKKIATITGELNTQSGQFRFEAFQSELYKNGINLPEKYIFQGDYSRRCARQAAHKFLGQKNGPTAVFAASDDMALEFISAAVEKGLKIPDDISVIGFDDNPACLFGPVSLTTVRQPLFQMAEEAVNFLTFIISGRYNKTKKTILSPELVIRDSCRPYKP